MPAETAELPDTLSVPENAEADAARADTAGSAKRPRKAALYDDERAGRIYRVAAQIIYEKGFAATSMNEIAEAVELTKPGLYYYVKGKKELLFAIMSFAMDLLDVKVVEPALEIHDAAERLRCIVAEHARLLTHDAGALAILIDEVGGLSEPQRTAITARKRAYFDFIRETLDSLQSENRLHGVDTTTATFSLLGMVMWLSRWYQTQGRMSGDTVVRDLTEIALRSVVREPDAGALDALVQAPVQ